MGPIARGFNKKYGAICANPSGGGGKAFFSGFGLCPPGGCGTGLCLLGELKKLARAVARRALAKRSLLKTAGCWSNWRRERDSNPRRAFDPYTLSRGAPSTTRPSLRSRKPPWAALRGGRPAQRRAMILKRSACGKKAASGAEPRPHELLHRGERRLERLGLGAAGLGEIRAAAAAPAHLRGHRPGELACLDTRGLIVGHADHQHHLGRALDARQHHHRGFELGLELIDGAAQRAR